MGIEDVDPGSIPPTVSSPVIWTKGKVNLHDSEKNPAKPKITLLRLGRRPVGEGALVMTGGPGGDAADGRFRRAEVGLCIMWLRLPLISSDPHRPCYLRLRPLSPFPSRNGPGERKKQRGWGGLVAFV